MIHDKPLQSTNVPHFERFIGVDWSGAKGRRHKGIAVAIAEAGNAAPEIVPPPAPAGWARGEVADWLEALPGPLLAGLDFSFAPPFLDRGAYLPGLMTADNGPDFWRHVDSLSPDEDYSAAGFIEGEARPHFWMGAADGPKAQFLHYRRVEQYFNARGGGKSSTLFDCLGAGQVAKASFAGMRLLHRLRGRHAIWPFDPPGPRTIVEGYTRVMLRHAGGRGQKLRDGEALNQALARLGSAPAAARDYNDHETDALVTAAALRRLAVDSRYWHPAPLTPEIARTEGWTFGIA